MLWKKDTKNTDTSIPRNPMRGFATPNESLAFSYTARRWMKG